MFSAGLEAGVREGQRCGYRGRSLRSEDNRTAEAALVNRNDECTENGKENAQKTVTTVHKNQ